MRVVCKSREQMEEEDYTFTENDFSVDVSKDGMHIWGYDIENYESLFINSDPLKVLRVRDNGAYADCTTPPGSITSVHEAFVSHVVEEERVMPKLRGRDFKGRDFAQRFGGIVDPAFVPIEVDEAEVEQRLDDLFK